MTIRLANANCELLVASRYAHAGLSMNDWLRFPFLPARLWFGRHLRLTVYRLVRWAIGFRSGRLLCVSLGRKSVLVRWPTNNRNLSVTSSTGGHCLHSGGRLR